MNIFTVRAKSQSQGRLIRQWQTPLKMEVEWVWLGRFVVQQMKVDPSLMASLNGGIILSPFEALIESKAGTWKKPIS